MDLQKEIKKNMTIIYSIYSLLNTDFAIYTVIVTKNP